MEDRRKQTGKKGSFYNIDDKIDHVAKPKTTKMILDFCVDESVSIKSFAVKEKKEVEAKTRFLSGKMLMLAKLSLMSFIYDILETFCFPDEKVKNIYEKYQIEDVYIYDILTDTDSTSLKFGFISNAASEIPDTKYREIIFEVICANDIVKRFATSHSFWYQFGYQKPGLRKCLGYFAVENINNPTKYRHAN